MRESRDEGMGDDDVIREEEDEDGQLLEGHSDVRDFGVTAGEDAAGAGARRPVSFGDRMVAPKPAPAPAPASVSVATAWKDEAPAGTSGAARAAGAGVVAGGPADAGSSTTRTVIRSGALPLAR